MNESAEKREKRTVPKDRKRRVSQMKKIIALLLSLAMALACFAACGKTESTESGATESREMTDQTDENESASEEVTPGQSEARQQIVDEAYKSQRFEDAFAYMSGARYTIAAEIFEELGDFENSREMLQQALDGAEEIYQKALECYNNEQWYLAYDWGIRLVGDDQMENITREYKDLATITKECKDNLDFYYYEAERAYNKGDYIAAYSFYQEIYGYKDSVQKCYEIDQIPL